MRPKPRPRRFPERSRSFLVSIFLAAALLSNAYRPHPAPAASTSPATQDKNEIRALNKNEVAARINLPADRKDFFERLVLQNDVAHKAALQELKAGGRQDNADLIPGLLVALETDDYFTPRRAASTLVMIGPAALPALKSALKDSNPYLRRNAELALGQLGAAAADCVPELAANLEDSDTKVWESARQVLIKIGSAAVPAMTGLLRSGSDEARLRVALTLAEMGPPAKSSAPELLKLTRSGRSDLSFTAAAALLNIDPNLPPTENNLPIFIQALKFKSLIYLADYDGARLGSAAAGEKIKDMEPQWVVPQLIRMLDDEDLRVRRLAPTSLKYFGPRAAAALPRLQRIAADANEDSMLRVRAGAAAAWISPPAENEVRIVGGLAENVTEYYNIRFEALGHLQLMGSLAKPAVPALVKIATEDRLSEFRRAAADILQKLGASPTRPSNP